MNKKRFYLFKNTIRGNFGEVDKPLNYTEIVNLLNEQEVEIDELNQENKQLRKQVESSETTSNATSHYNAFLESKITTLEEENRELRHELDSLSGCYCADNKEFKDYWRIGYDE